MGFLDIIKKFFTQDENIEYYHELDESIIVELAKIRQRILAMKIYYPTKAQEIEKEITELEKYIEHCIETDSETQNDVNERYLKIKEEFQTFNKISQEKFLFNEVKRVYLQLDNIFWRKEEQTINEEEIERFKQTLKILDKNKKEFTGMKQQQFIKAIIDAKYRLRSCQMLESHSFHNFFADAPEVERIFYANLFLQDIEKMYCEMNQIKNWAKLGEVEIDLGEQESELDLVVPFISDSYTIQKEHLITDVFKEDSIMEHFIKVRRALHDKSMSLQKEIQEEKSRKEKEKYYKTVTEKEQRKKLEEMDNNTFDTTSSYKSILEYEKNVARAKGLLDKKSEMALNDVDFFRIEKNEISEYWLRAKETKKRISILPNVDVQKKNVLVFIKKGESLEETIPVDICMQADSIYFDWIKIPDFKFSTSFIKYIQTHKMNKGIEFDEKHQAYISKENRKKRKQIIEDICQKILEKKGDKPAEEVKFYIEMSYLRPMTPILERLKEEGIDYYIPPIDDKTLQYNPVKKIYMDRKYLEKYKDRVHKEISGGQKGAIIIGAQDVNQGKLIIGKNIEYREEEL